MVLASNQPQSLGALSVEVAPNAVDAGASLFVTGAMSYSPPLDLHGKSLEIRDDEGALRGSAAFTSFEDGINRTDEFVLKAPIKAGAYTWLAVCPAHEQEGISYMETSTPLAFTVKAHATNIVVWDVPSAIETGDSFKLKIGVRCSSACLPADRLFSIRDHNGDELVSTTLPATLWPGTAALYYREIELKAPDTLGLHQWEAQVPETDDGMPHQLATFSFGVTVVPAPEHMVTIEAVDRSTQAPIEGAQILIHPYRATTNENGIARIRVPAGSYKIFVSASRYYPVRTMADVSEDLTTKAELVLEPKREKN